MESRAEERHKNIKYIQSMSWTQNIHTQHGEETQIHHSKIKPSSLNTTWTGASCVMLGYHTSVKENIP